MDDTISIKDTLNVLLEKINEEMDEQDLKENMSFEKDGKLIDFEMPISEALYSTNSKYYVNLSSRKKSFEISFFDELNNRKSLGVVECPPGEELEFLRGIIENEFDSDQFPSDYQFVTKNNDPVSRKQEKLKKRNVLDCLKDVENFSGKISLRLNKS